MVWVLIGRRPLMVRDLAVSLEDGPWLLNHISKVWRLLFWRIYINIDSEFNRYFRSNFAKQGVAKLWKYDEGNHGPYLMKPHGLWSAEVGGS